jgi:ParB-like nuclease domain
MHTVKRNFEAGCAMNHPSEYRSIPIADLVESTTNPRKGFDETQLEELAESMRVHGMLSPLTVRTVNGHFEIIAGARRYRAAKRAGLTEALPASSPSRTTRPRNFKSSKTSSERMFTLLKRRKVFALCSTAAAPTTPSRKSPPPWGNLRLT